MNWYIIDKEYVKYLHKQDKRVENYVPVSSAKEKHYKMNDYIDLYKIKRKEEILGVLNINNMIPIKKEYAQILKYDEIEKYRKFKSLKEKQHYIELLDIELKIINRKELEIIENARKLYNLVIKYPMSRLAKRSCDFKMLELKANEYEKEK